jgi:hypothetical protein
MVVVEPLEIVDVDEEQSEADPAAPQFRKPRVHTGLQVTPVRQPRQRIDEGEFLELFNLLLQGRALAEVGEDLDSAGDPALGVAQWGGPDPDRQAVAPLVVQVDLGFVRTLPRWPPSAGMRRCRARPPGNPRGSGCCPRTRTPGLPPPFTR